jgi:hypothetical protein
MYLTAHRAEASSGEDGINAFHYAHGTGIEPTAPKPGDLIENIDCGVCVNTVVSVKLGGNRVRSYMEVLALDEVPQHEISRAVTTVLVSLVRFPHEGRSGRCFVRVALDQGIIERYTWIGEVGNLYRAILSVRLPLNEAERLYQQCRSHQSSTKSVKTT